MSEPDEFFPIAERVLYERSPLIEVVCQVRFPTILRIEAETPASFQDALRHLYPVYEAQRHGGVQGLPPEIAQMVGAAIKTSVHHQFISSDGFTTITLSPDALGVTSTAYNRWELFAAPLKLALDALLNIYQPSFVDRIGLRYQNAVIRSDLGLDNKPWSALLSKNILGELGHAGFSDAQLLEAFRIIRAKSRSGNDGILLQHGLGQRGQEKSQAYIFDIDCYTETRHDIADVEAQLVRFNARARHAFRWCISDDMHIALGPRSVDELATC